MTYWKDSLLVGVAIIDREHRKLVGVIDQLMEACSQGKGRSAIEQTLDFVISYAKEHFRDEEQLQEKYTYPGMIAHKKLHAQFVANMTSLENEFRQTGPSVVLTGKLNSSLVDWLIKHISTEDKILGEHIRKAGGS